MFVLFVMRSYLIEVRGLKLARRGCDKDRIASYLIEVRGLKRSTGLYRTMTAKVVSYRGTWVETVLTDIAPERKVVVSYRGTWVETLPCLEYLIARKSYLIEVRGLKLRTYYMDTLNICRIL